MSISHVLHVVGLLLVFVGLSMLAALGVSLVYHDGDSAAFFLATVITVLVGVGLWFATSLEGEITPREGYAIVTFAWTATALAGALPYLLTGHTGFWGGVFESMSGFTTTGATVFSEIETLPHGILFWRSLTHWLGGMGIIVLAIAVLPYLGVGGMQLFKAEVPGPTPERLRPRITQTAKLLWLVYFGLTVAQIVLYLIGGMNLFDAVNHSFATLATGGFSTKNASMAAFDSGFIQWVTILFMYLAGVNFSLHFRAATGRFAYFRDVEWRFFTAVVLGFGLLIAAIQFAGAVVSGDLAMGALARLGQDLTEGVFQAVSIATTTGFVNADYEVWAPAAQVLLFTLMLIGGMAGSTGGGIKAVRIFLLLKQAGMELRKHLHPRAVFISRMGPHVIREEVMANVVGFVLLYLLLALAGAIAMAALGTDLLTAIAASLATVGNIGPGFGDVGATDNYGWMGSAQLGVLTFLMLVGRLEIFTVLLLFLPETWRRRRRAVVKAGDEA